MDAGELITAAGAHGGSFLGGSAISAWIIRQLFGDVSKRLDKIEETLEAMMKTQNERHEKLIERLAHVESKADAAHRRLDELPTRRRR